MKANELRIGNILKGGEVVSIDIMGVIFRNNFNNTYSGIHPKCKPIKLTPEILEQCGFEKINNIHGYYLWSMKRKRNDSKPSIDIYDRYTIIGNISRVKHCVYLHQLQNLYYALTGKELTQRN